MRIIAEVGCNWKDIDEAKQFIKISRNIGVDLVKFQLFSIDYARDHNIPIYLSLSYDQAEELFEYGKEMGQEVFFTPIQPIGVQPTRVQWCEDIGVKRYKIRFADHNNKKLRGAIRETGKPFFCSKPNPLQVLDEEIPLLCIPKYPATREDYTRGININLFRGLSDHTPDLIFLYDYCQYLSVLYWWEKHVKLRENCLETEWSVNLHKLGEVLKRV